MKRKFLLFVTTVLLVCMAGSSIAFGANAERTADQSYFGGVHNKVINSGFELVLKDADGNAAARPSGIIGNATHAVTVFDYVAKIDVKVKGGAADTEYLVFLLKPQSGSPSVVPTANNIAYIDQKKSDSNGNVTFTIYPQDLSPDGKENGTYEIYVSYNGSNGLKEVGKFDVTTWTKTAYTLGDLNGDNSVDIIDAQLMMKHIASLSNLTGNSLLAANLFTKDGNDVNIIDAQIMIKYIASLIDHFG